MNHLSFIRTRNSISFLLLAVFLFACKSSVNKPQDGSQRVAIPELSDEFDGTSLDTNKWWPNNPAWLGREPSYFHVNNVEVKNGNLLIHQRKERFPDMPERFTYTTGAIKSKMLVKYGYFEIRCKTMPAYATSAFWFYHNTDKYWTEIDVFEILGTKEPKTVYMTLHVMPPSLEKHLQSGDKWTGPDNLYENFHTYAVDWNKDEIIFYVDSVVRRKVANTYWHDLLYLNIDSEIMPEWIGFDDSYLPATYTIDYVRAWK